MILEKVKTFIEEKKLFAKQDSLLVAISGGIDSVVLAHCLKKLEYPFRLVHCNFQLRGEESNQDEKFVRHLAIDLDCEIDVKRFDLNKENGSIQLQAREVRYAWFKELQKIHQGYLLTAHHKSDVLETVLINLGRGTGLEGLHGIEPKNDRGIIRPLLCVTKEEIEAFGKANGISFREDSSNKSDAYIRNRLRNELIPILKDIFPQIEERTWDTTQRVKESEVLLKENTNKKWEDIVSIDGDQVRIPMHAILEQSDPLSFLFNALKKYGFSKDNLDQLLKSTTIGAKVETKNLELFKDREQWILRKKPLAMPKAASPVFKIEVKNAVLEFPLGKLQVTIDSDLPDLSSITPSECYLDNLKLHFPLTLRKWKNGDKFKPLGMDGFKKVSDFLIDKKIPLANKDSIWVLCSQEEIVWVLNYRLDDRFKVTQETEEVLKLEIH